MSTDVVAPVSESATATPAWPPLTLHERRVLGVLAEKAKTTPDIYPLSLNALVTGCNQKSNRDPVLQLVDAEVEQAVASLKKSGHVQQIMGSGRVDKFKHTLYETLKVGKVELAIITELLLRGPQTEGDLRGRASRMEPIGDLEELRTPLRLLAQRGLVVYLTPEGRRGTVVTHGFYSPQELERLRSAVGREANSPGVDVATTRNASDPTLLDRLQRLESDLAKLWTELHDLQSTVARLVPPEN